MYDLKALAGDLILGVFIPIDPKMMKTVRLHKVEPYGIWIESQEFTEKVLSRMNLTYAAESPAIFLPWCQVACIAAAISIPALSERALQQ